MLKVMTFIAFVIVAAKSRNWTSEDAAEVAIHIAEKFHATCLVFIPPSCASPEEVTLRHRFLMKILKAPDAKWLFTVTSTFLSRIVEVKFSREGHTNCFHPIFFILDYESLKFDLEPVSHSVQFTNSIWLLLLNSPADAAFFSKMRIQVNAEFYLLAFDGENDTAIFSEVYSVGKTPKMEVVHLGFWSKRQGLVLHAVNYFKRRRNLRQQVLKVAAPEILDGETDYEDDKIIHITLKIDSREFFQNWPIVTFNPNAISDGRKLDGFFARIWTDLEQAMNFTSKFLNNVTTLAGLEVSEGLFNGLVGLAQRKEVDAVLFDLTLTPARGHVIRLVQPLIKTRYQVYFRFNGFVVEWLSIFRPLSSDVWFALLALIFISTFALFWMNRTMNRFAIFEHFPLKFYETFFLVLQTFCAQGIARIPRNSAFRIFVAFCYLTAAVILSFYSAALISVLTKKTEVRPFDSVEALLQAKHPLMVLPNTGVYEMFERSKHPLYRGLYDLINPEPEMRELQTYKQMIEYICLKKSSAAVFGVDTSMRILLRQMELNGEGCRIVEFTHGVYPAFRTLAFQKDSPYSNFANIVVLWFHERGLLSRYKKLFIPPWIKKVEEPIFEVNIAEIATVFAIMLGGILLAAILLVLELLYYYWKEAPKIYFYTN